MLGGCRCRDQGHPNIGTPPGLRGCLTACTDLGFCCHPRQRILGLFNSPRRESFCLDSSETPRKVQKSLLPVSHGSQCHCTGRGSRQTPEGGMTHPCWAGKGLMPSHCAAVPSTALLQHRRGHWPCPPLAAASATCLLDLNREKGLQLPGWAPVTVWLWSRAGRAGQSLSCCCLCQLVFILPGHFCLAFAPLLLLHRQAGRRPGSIPEPARGWIQPSCARVGCATPASLKAFLQGPVTLLILPGIS